MPPRRSTRNKRPSSQALEALATTPQRRRRGVSSQDEPVAATADQIQPEVSIPSFELPPQVVSDIVARVTAEVTRQVQPLLASVHVQATPQLMSQVPAQQVQQLQPSQDVQPTREVPITDADSQAQAAIQPALQATHGALAGELLRTDLHRPKDLFSSVNLPVDARVSNKTKTKIWNQEFIDFGSLLVNPTLDGRYQLTIQNSGEGIGPALSLEPVNKAKKITCIDTWLQAFHVFVGIYTSRYPHEAPGLMKYGATVQDLAIRGHNWRFYDDNFRYLRQTQASSLPWDSIHWELWLRSQNNPRTQRTPPAGGSRKPFSPLRVPTGYCFKFHKGGDCSGCVFKHSCFKCEGSHRALNCNFRAPSRQVVHQSRGSSQPSVKPNTPQPLTTPVTNTRRQ